MSEKKVEAGYIADRRQDVDFRESIFGSACQDELRELDKHEIIVRICEILGPEPHNLAIAEEIFDSVRIDMARHVIHHEYSRESGVKSRLLFWLDNKANPDNAEKFESFMTQFFK
jgi:hypothetical protein